MWKKRVFRICHYSMKLYLTYIWPVLTLSEIEMDIRSKVFATRFPSWITSWILFHSSGHSLRRHPVATEEQRRRQASTHLESDLEEAALRPEGTGAANVHVRVIDSLQQTHKVGAVILKRNKKKSSTLFDYVPSWKCQLTCKLCPMMRQRCTASSAASQETCGRGHSIKLTFQTGLPKLNNFYFRFSRVKDFVFLN